MGIYPDWALGEKRTQGTAISALGVGGRGGGSTWETTVAWRGEAARVLDSGSSGLLCAPQTHPFIPPPPMSSCITLAPADSLASLWERAGKCY